MATIPVMRTWVTGEVVTAAEMNSNVRDPANFLLGTPMAEAYASAAQSHTSSGNWQVVTLDSNVINTDGMYSAGLNNRLTCQTAGTYLVSGCVGFAASATGNRFSGIGLNGAVVGGVSSSSGPGAAGNPIGYGLSPRRIHLNAGDYIQLVGWQSSGGTLAYNTGNQNTFLSAQMVSTN